MKIRTWMTMLAMACLAVTAGADVFDDLATYRYGASPNVAEQAFEQVLAAPAADKAAIEQKLIAVLSNAGATADGKAWACRALQIIGTDAAVPALAGLLKDEVLADYARLPLERMTGSKAARAALADALDKAPDGVKIGILASLGNQRAAEAVTSIGRLTTSRNPAVALAAITALGKIADGGAARVLLRVKPTDANRAALLDAWIAAAKAIGGGTGESLYQKAYASDSTTHRIAGLVGMATLDPKQGAELITTAILGRDAALRDGALSAVVEVPGAPITAALVASLDSLDAAGQARLLDALGARGDSAALAKVLTFADAADATVREKALAAIGKLGNVGAATDMLRAAAAGKNADAMIMGVAGIKDPAVDGAIVAAIKDPALRLVALKAAAERGPSGAQPAVMACLSDADPKVQEAAWNVLGKIGDAALMPDMMKAAQGVADAGMQGRALEAVKRVFSGSDDQGKAFEALAPYYDAGSTGVKHALLALAPMAATPTALGIAHKALGAGDAELYDAALRGLTSWRSAHAADPLLEIAKTAPKETQKILALRGVIQLAGARHVKLNVNQRVELLEKAAAIASRADEKRQIIGMLRNQHTPVSLQMLVGYMADDALVVQAADGATFVAERIARHHKADSVKALDAVIKRLTGMEKQERLLQRATDLHKRFQS